MANGPTRRNAPTRRSSRSTRNVPTPRTGQVHVSSGRRSTQARGGVNSSRRSGVQQEATRYARDGYSRRSRKNQGTLRSNFNTNASGYREVRVGDVRTTSRTLRRPSRAPRIILVVVLLAAVLGGAGFALYHSDVLPVRQVTVSGNSHISNELVTELAAVPEGSTLLRVDSEGITARLKLNPWVDSVSVERVLPETVNLAITERTIGAVVEVKIDDSDNTEDWALSTDGIWLCQLPTNRESEEGKAVLPSIYEDADAVLKISGVPYGQRPVAGEACNSANVSNALAIVSGMSTELAGQVKTVSATSSESTTITLTNGVEIAFGDANDIREKERVCLELMQQHEGQIAYINVRVVNKPTWRSL